MYMCISHNPVVGPLTINISPVHNFIPCSISCTYGHLVTRETAFPPSLFDRLVLS